MQSQRSHAQSPQASEMEESLENDVQDIIDRYLNEQPQMPPSEATFQYVSHPNELAHQAQSQRQPTFDDVAASVTSSHGLQKGGAYASPQNVLSK